MVDREKRESLLRRLARFLSRRTGAIRTGTIWNDMPATEDDVRRARELAEKAGLHHLIDKP